MPKRHIIGCMTGTSLDGLDAALVEIEGAGRDMRACLVAHTSKPLGKLRGALNRLARGLPAMPLECLRAARALGLLHADACEELANQHPTLRINFITAHGQTIWHAPDEGLSWQLLDPWPAVRRLRTPVLYDLRQADLIAGGQGGPIASIADPILFASAGHAMIVHLGGVCSVSVLPKTPEGRVEGFDLGPCNLLLDGIVKTIDPAKAYDVDGRLAERGEASDVVYRLMLKHPFFKACPNRATGREDFNDDWVAELVKEARQYLDRDADLLASAAEAVAMSLAQANVRLRCPRVVLAGGGAKNPALVERVRRAIGGQAKIMLSTEFGLPVDAVAPAAMAVLGALTQDGVPITLPHITGASDPGLAGAWAKP